METCRSSDRIRNIHNNFIICLTSIHQEFPYVSQFQLEHTTPLPFETSPTSGFVTVIVIPCFHIGCCTPPDGGHFFFLDRLDLVVGCASIFFFSLAADEEVCIGFEVGVADLNWCNTSASWCCNSHLIVFQSFPL